MSDNKVLTGYPSIDKPWLKFYKPGIENNKLPQETIYEYLYQNCINHLDDIAIVYFNNKITYRELLNNIDLVANTLLNDGLTIGDTITICSVTSPEVIYCLYACSKIGVTCNMMDPRVNADNIILRIKETNSKMLFILDVVYHKIKDYDNFVNKIILFSLKDSMDVFTKIGYIITNKVKIKYSSKFITYKNYLNKTKVINDIKPVSYQPNNQAVIEYTSGTTGIPKGAILTDDSMNSIAWQYQFPFAYEWGYKFLNIMPPFISYGLVCGIHMPLCLGLKMIIIPAFEEEKFGEYILKYKPEFTLGTPGYYECLIHNKKIINKDLSFIHVIGMGGDAVNGELEKDIEKFIEIHHIKSGAYKGYGMTEMASAALTLSTVTGSKRGSVGIPLPLTTASIFEPGTDHELKYGETGEICLKGPGMMKGYLNNIDETNKIFIKHSDESLWAHTQDLGYMDNEGFVYFIDRIKRVIIRPDGFKVWPSPIVNVLTKHEMVKDCVVVGIIDKQIKNGKIPTAFIVLKDNNIDSNNIINTLDIYCKEHLPEKECPMKYIIIDKIPMTLNGKVDYQKLEEQVE